MQDLHHRVIFFVDIRAEDGEVMEGTADLVMKLNG